MKKFYKLFIVGASILTTASLLSSCEITLPTEPIDEPTVEPEPEVEKFNVFFLLDDKYEIEDTQNFSLDENGHAKVEKNTRISFKIKVSDEAILGSDGLIVKVNNNEIGSNEGTYTVLINKDTRIDVEGFIDEAAKHHVSFNHPYGVKIINDSYEPYPDGSYLLEDTSFTFEIELLTGFKEDNLVVKANNNVLTKNNGKYSFNLNNDVVVDISGVKYEQTVITMVDSDLFSFANVKGAVVKGDYAYVTEDTVSFKVIPTAIADKENSNIVVKNGEEVLIANNGTYSFEPSNDSVISVLGLNKITETSQTTEQTFSRTVIAESAMKSITSSNGAVVSGEVNDLADIENGFKKATYFAGEYGSNQLALNSTENFEKFRYLEFEINPYTGDYIEFYTPVKSGANFYIRERGWTKIEIVLNEDGGYHCLVAGTDKGLVANKNNLISDLQFRIQGTYLISELIVQKDVNYVDPHHYIDTSALPDLGEPVDSEVTEYGTKKWYGPKDSKINVAMNLSTIGTNQFSEIYFEVKVAEDYGSVVWFGAAKNPSWEVKQGNIGKFILTKNAAETFDLTFIGKDTKTAKNIELDDDLANFAIYAHGKSTSGSYVGQFYISNLRVVNDPEYDPNGQKTVIINDNAEHVSYTVDGYTGSTFKVDKDSTITLRTTADSGYTEKVKANGIALKGSSGVYSIVVSKNTTIEINEDIKHNIEKIADKFIDTTFVTQETYNGTFNTVDPNIDVMYKNTKKCEDHYALIDTDISEYKYLYFYVKNISGAVFQIYAGLTGTGGYTAVGTTGEISKVSFINSDGTWSVAIDDVVTTKYTKATNTLQGIFYVQFWGDNLLSPLYGYKN